MSQHCLNTCFLVSTHGVSTPILASQHLTLKADLCLNVKTETLDRSPNRLFKIGFRARRSIPLTPLCRGESRDARTTTHLAQAGPKPEKFTQLYTHSVAWLGRAQYHHKRPMEPTLGALAGGLAAQAGRREGRTSSLAVSGDMRVACRDTCIYIELYMYIYI